MVREPVFRAHADIESGHVRALDGGAVVDRAETAENKESEIIVRHEVEHRVDVVKEGVHVIDRCAELAALAARDGVVVDAGIVKLQGAFQAENLAEVVADPAAIERVVVQVLARIEKVIADERAYFDTPSIDCRMGGQGKDKKKGEPHHPSYFYFQNR